MIVKVVAFVPVKLNNERLPNKNTKTFDNGKPLIFYTLDTITKVTGIDEIYVYCSSDEIKTYLPIHGVSFLKRPDYLDNQNAGGLDLIDAFRNDIKADVYMKIHATSPFVKIESFEKGLEAVRSKKYDSAFPVTVNHEFLWNNGLPNYDVNNIPRTQDLTPFYIETTAYYIYTRQLAEQRRRIGDNPFLVEVSKIEAIDINEPVDFEIANACLKIFNR